MPSASINGFEFWYEDRGRANQPVVVLLHGFPMDGRIWADLLDDLSISHRVIVPDLRGFGRSKDSSPFTMESLADDLHGLITRLKIGPCVLAGLSMGGYVSLALARRHAVDIAGVTLVDSRTDGDSPQARVTRGEMIELARSKGSEAISRVMMPRLLGPGALANRPIVAKKPTAITHACPALTIEHALAAMRDRADQTSWLASVNLPVHFIVGEEDTITPPELAREQAKKIGRGEVTVIPSAGHLACLEQPAQTARAISEFVRRCL
jgi:pimeloyl-ACP methyl ester carboxylesterase